MKISRVAFWCTTGCWIVAMVHMFMGRYDAASACAVVGLYGPAFEIMWQMRGGNENPIYRFGSHHYVAR